MTKIMVNIEKIFKCFFLLHLLLAFNSIYNATSMIGITSAISLVLAGILIVWRVINIKKLNLGKEFIILALFFVSFVISSLLNREYGIAENAKCLIWMAIFVAILFYNSEKADQEKDFKMISRVFIWYVFVVDFLGLIMFFDKYNAYVTINGNMRRIGFFWNRLWSFYEDVNQGALFSVIAFMMAMYLVSKYKKKIYIVTLPVFYIFTLLTDSRTGLLCFAVAIFLYIIFYCVRKFDDKKKLIAIPASILAVVLIVVSYKPLQKTFVYISNALEKSVITGDDGGNQIEDLDEVEIEREEIKSDPSNRRFSIWKSGLELVKESPVFGLGRYTYTPYAADRLPDTYIVSNGLQEFDAMHNILMDVLVSQGVVGLVLFVILMLYCICKIVKNRDLLLSEKCWEFAVFNFIILVVNVAAAMVLPNLLYINSPGAYVSWLCLGNMINLIKGGEIKEET